MAKRRGSRSSRGQINAGVPTAQQPSKTKLEQQAEDLRLAVVAWMDETVAYDAEQVRRLQERIAKLQARQAAARNQQRILTPEERKAAYRTAQQRRKAAARSKPPRRETCVVETGMFQTVCNGNYRGTGAAYTLEPVPDQPGVLVETRIGQMREGEQEMIQSIQDLRYAYHLKRQLASKINGTPRDEFLEQTRAQQPDPHILVIEKQLTGRTISAAALGAALSSLPAPR